MVNKDFQCGTFVDKKVGKPHNAADALFFWGGGALIVDNGTVG